MIVSAPVQEQRPNSRQTSPRARLLSAILIISWLLAACGSNQQAPAVGDPAPDFSLNATDGDTISLSDYQGKQAVLLYFHMAVG